MFDTAAEERLKQLHSKPRQLDLIMDTLGGRLLHGRLVFQQQFLIKSYELDPEGKVSIVALVNHLQPSSLGSGPAAAAVEEFHTAKTTALSITAANIGPIKFLEESALGHLKSVGLLADGFGSTLEMHRRDLIWVAYRLQIEVERLSSWADVVQVETWISSASEKHIKYDWIVRDCKTGKTLIRAKSLYLMVNKKTRKVSFAKEVGAEIKPHVMNCDPLINQDKKKTPALGF
ncbi:hypothetical protein SO802_005647 [Lithocarpus litseifolius]|uniref:Acyl-[acyl-carrier-protein] hydrolase n=1 Tax=Lithocarpus litseifolius TaxID=425828 RepID=A0AAW2DLX7_9ROSI